MTNEQKIAHVLMNVMYINVAMFYVYFGKTADQIWKESNVGPGSSYDQLQQTLKDYISQYMLSDPEHIEELYNEIKGNNELIDNLPE